MHDVKKNANDPRVLQFHCKLSWKISACKQQNECRVWILTLKDY